MAFQVTGNILLFLEIDPIFLLGDLCFSSHSEPYNLPFNTSRLWVFRARVHIGDSEAMSFGALGLKYFGTGTTKKFQPSFTSAESGDAHHGLTLLTK